MARRPAAFNRRYRGAEDRRAGTAPKRWTVPGEERRADDAEAEAEGRKEGRQGDRRERERGSGEKGAEKEKSKESDRATGAGEQLPGPLGPLNQKTLNP